MKICWFGIYRSNFSRNKIYIKGLRKLGHEVLECNSSAQGFKKYIELWKKHRALKGQYDVMVVGYPGHLVVPFAKFLSDKPVVADLLGSLEDAEVHSHYAGFVRIMKDKIIDRMAVKFADAIMLETKAEVDYFSKKYGNRNKYHVVYSGADGDQFNPPVSFEGRNLSPFLILFRGRLTPESGIMHFVRAAMVLKDHPDIKFRIMGSGPFLEQVEREIKEKNLGNIEVISAFLSEEEMRKKMCEACLSIGQIEDNPRLNRTVPHKLYDSFALGLPYLTGDAPAVREQVREGETGFLCKLADGDALATKILEIYGNKEIVKRVSENEKKKFRDELDAPKVATDILKIFAQFT